MPTLVQSLPPNPNDSHPIINPTPPKEILGNDLLVAKWPRVCGSERIKSEQKNTNEERVGAVPFGRGWSAHL